MYLLQAPNSYQCGFKEPRCYLDVDKNFNYSTMNNNGTGGKDFIWTNFSKIRIIIIKTKRGNITEHLDCADFRFASANNNSF